MTVDGAGVRRLNWGCGAHGEPGWCNSDLKDGPGIDLTCDIRDGLPVPDESFDYAVSVHALPMISHPDLVPVLEELKRVLRPGGVLRLVLPDLERALDAWKRGDRDYFLVPDSDESTLSGKLICQLLWYGWSVTLFTEEFIVDLLWRAGYSEVHPATCGWSPTATPGICDLDNRERESIFVEAVR